MLLSASKYLLRETYKSLFSFCQQINRKDKRKSFMSLNQLRQAVQRQHFFVRKNYKEIGSQIMYNINSNHWQKVKKILLIININELDSWLLLRNIAKAINNTCNNIQIQKMSQHNLISLLSVLVLLRFEPRRSKDKYVLRGEVIQFDDSTHFINQLEKYINRMSVQENPFNYFQVVRKLIHTNPYLFINKRSQIQSQIFTQLQELMSSRFLLNDLLIKGCISKFWTNEFKLEISKANIPEICKKSINFENLDIATKIEKSQKRNNVKTQGQIINILQGWGYEVEQNVIINEYEVDFIIANKLIVQYNGHHHYVINSDQLILTAKDRWKQSVLNKRNFALSTIPYQEWKVLKLFQQKRNYLVNKIEKDWLKYYKSHKELKK